MARQRADAHEREALAMRATQMPLRLLGFRPYDDRHGEERLDLRASFLRRRVHPPEIPHALPARREHVLEVVVFKSTRLSCLKTG